MKEILEKYKSFITEYEIIVWDSEPTSYRFKARISFNNGSHLIVRDYLYPAGRKYSFHWQDKKDNMIARWDNAAHWREIDTFPHHKHDKEIVGPSNEVSIEDILKYVCEILKK